MRTSARLGAWREVLGVQVSYTPTGPNIGHCPQQLPVSQLVREDTDATGKGGHADSEKEKVFPEAEAREHGPERKTDTALEGLQRPPSARDPVGQVLPCRPEAAEAPTQPASPPQPSDHSYALLDLDALKKKLFVTLKENEKLRKRLKAQRLVMRRLCRRLRAHRAAELSPAARLSHRAWAVGLRFGGSGHEPFRPAADSGSEACR
ncbi:THAP domain-containing protein 3 [Myotis brandtii]|uniref:THAP domain-containing protein 3 n=1 Tax=Myotis brandtii TaxID=109478 RepID=S7PPI0_MYOBR|nr:THAP domain-containing protein 3 [Myotis brandtii]